MKEELQNVLKDICAFPVPSEEEWYEAAAKSLKGKSVEKMLYTETDEGITLKPLYFEHDREKLTYANSLPGYSPHLRGMKVLPEKPHPWEITQKVVERTPEAAGQEVSEGLAKGQHGITIQLNEAILAGEKLHIDNVGDIGVLASDAEDFAELFAGINWEDHSIYIDAGPDVLPVFALWAAAAEEKGGLSKAKGSVAADPLGHWVKTGSLPVSLETCYDHAAKIIEWCKEKDVAVRTILVTSEPYHNGSASAVEEIAYTMAAAVAYIRALQERGIPAQEAVSSFQFRYPAGASFFMEIAKFRAARLLWSNIQEAFGIDETERVMHVQGTTSKRTKAKYDPYVNMLRATTESFAAAAGGADSLEVAPFDEAFQRPTAFSKRIARNTQIILQEEAHVGRTIDSGGGSFYIEQLTDELAAKSWELFQEIEGEGGLEVSLHEGGPQKRVETRRAEKENQVEKQQRVFVGVNKYADIQEKPVSVTPEDDIEQVSRFIKRSNEKRPAVTDDSLNHSDNVVEDAITAAKNGAPVSALAKKSGWGLHVEKITPLAPMREAEMFEKLRENAEKYKERNNQELSALLVTLGPLAAHKARADFASGFLQTGGFHVKRTEGVQEAEEAAQAAAEAEESIIVLCGADAAYEELALPAIRLMKEKAPEKTILLAGKLSSEQEQEYADNGLDDTIHLRSNLYKTLTWLQSVEGAKV
ncbi:methylmalonyl-CoA mutase family protein [Bacillus piscicola]|uniref:methylmalonyl-CoA mutase family protein n=1 Tax=Bacillus piscicola TaxID=1632684 RepID=UPI001F08F2F7|nr:methylmalonyl-CoA mutase family protein [Bacillus piscicola]